MAYEGSDHSGIKKVGGVVLTIAIVLIVGAIAKSATREAINYSQTSPSAVEESLEDAMSENPALRPMFSALKQNYPEAHQRYIDEISSSMRRGASQTELNQQSFNFMRSFTAGLRADLVVSPDRKLFAVRDKTIDFVNLLSQESSILCAQFALDGLRPGAQLSDQANALLSETSALGIEAAAAGRDQPNPRDAATDADWELLIVEMFDSGITEAEIVHMSEGTVSSLAMDRQCALGRSIYNSLAAVPDAASARLSSEVLFPSQQ